MSSYSKKFATFEEQLSILKARGLEVGDDAAAVELLQRVGYYTLGGYLYSMREIVPTGEGHVRADRFLPGASFEQVAALYDFDRNLRLLCLEVLETLERRVKVAVAYSLGSRDLFAHTNGRFHDQGNLRAPPGKTQSPHAEWCATHESKVRRRGNPVMTAFVDKYGTPLPIWVATDAMDFGDVSKLIGFLGRRTQTEIARQFGVSHGVVFASWVRTLCLVRNLSAHHDRLWNRELVDIPRKPKGAEDVHFAEILPHENLWHRTYAALIIAAFLVKEIGVPTSWPRRVAEHLFTLPTGPGVDFAGLGAPDTWIDNPIWA